MVSMALIVLVFFWGGYMGEGKKGLCDTAGILLDSFMFAKNIVPYSYKP